MQGIEVHTSSELPAPARYSRDYHNEAYANAERSKVQKAGRGRIMRGREAEG